MSMLRALLALLVLWPFAAFAEEPDTDDAAADERGELVSVVSSDGSTKGSHTHTSELHFEFRVKNGLPMRVERPRFEVELVLTSGAKETVHLSKQVAIPPGATIPVIIDEDVSISGEVRSFQHLLEGYDLATLDAATLTSMYTTGGDTDMKVALDSLGLDPAATDAEARRSAARATPGLVAGFRKQLEALPGEVDFRDVLGSYLAIRALGRLGSAEDIPVLVNLLDRESDGWDAVGEVALHDLPDIIAPVLGPDLTFTSAVASALHELDAKAGLSALLVARATGTLDMANAAGTAIEDGWPTQEERVRLLKDLGPGPVLDALAADGSGSDAGLLLRLSLAGNAAAEAALAKVPAHDLARRLLPVVTDASEPLSQKALALLVAHEKETRNELADAELEAGVHPVAEASLDQRILALAQARIAARTADLEHASAPPAPAGGSLPTPAARLEELALLRDTRLTPALEVKYAAAYLEWVAAALPGTDVPRNLAWKVLQRAESALAGHPLRAQADASLAKVAAEIGKLPDDPRARMWLEKLPSLGGDGARVAAARAWEALAARAGGSERLAYAAKALALDPQSPQALAMKADHESAERTAVAVPVVLLLVLLGIGWFVVRSGPAHYLEGDCGKCGKADVPLNQVSFHYNVGLLVARMQGKTEGALCKGCIHETFWKYFLTNLFVGWWGLISMLFTPFLQLINLFHYLRSWHLPHRKADPFLVPGPGGNS